MEVIVIKIVLATIFALSILAKVTGKTKSTFERSGYSPTVMYATAIAEIIFTLGLFTRYEFFSTVGLLAIIGAAFLTLFRQRVQPSKYIIALAAAVLLIALLVLKISNASSIT